LRYYDPANARFVTRDPIGYDGGINLYAFCADNPVMGVDPMGTDCLDVIQGVADAAGLIPGLNVPAEAVSGGISLYRGDYVGAALSAGALIPFAGDAGAAAKIARRVARAKKSIAVLRGVADAEELAKAGKDLYVGTYRGVTEANAVSGLIATHSPHHVVQDAASGLAHGEGVVINIRKNLHEITRTMRRPVVPGTARQHLGRDMRDLRGVPRNAGCERRTVNRQMRELIRQNLNIIGGP
jgi:uncharacterized protein RhaS with RHS repeats